MKKQLKKIVLAKLQVIVMPNGDVVFMGRVIGIFKDCKKYLSDPHGISEKSSIKVKT